MKTRQVNLPTLSLREDHVVMRTFFCTKVKIPPHFVAWRGDTPSVRGVRREYPSFYDARRDIPFKNNALFGFDWQLIHVHNNPNSRNHTKTCWFLNKMGFGVFDWMWRRQRSTPTQHSGGRLKPKHNHWRCTVKMNDLLTKLFSFRIRGVMCWICCYKFICGLYFGCACCRVHSHSLKKKRKSKKSNMESK